MPAPFAPNNMQQPLPSLYLYPLNDSFLPKHIHLPQGPRIKIGRQTNAKTAPGERNGFFDSKVLSRQHAEVWEENGKIYIKDVKSSNGTFINGERLSPEGAESDPFELKTDDIVEFGIDIVGEDNKTIIHHKVAARVVCVFTEQDAAAAARAEQHQQNPAMSSLSQPNGAGPGGSAFNFAGAQGGTGGPGGPGQRRPGTMQQQGLAGMGGMGANMRPPGKSGLTFDHILNRLQGELQKTRETGAELHSLTGAMNDIHDTLGGNLPQLPPYPQSLPPVMPPQPPAQQPNEAVHPNNHPNGTSSPGASPTALSELQVQLQETQMSLASHVDKIRSLEGMLAEHDSIKREVSILREMMEDEKRELEMVRSGRRRSNTVRGMGSSVDGEGDGDGDEFALAGDDDDTRSIATITPHELERVDEEDEEQLAAERDADDMERRQHSEMTRPRTPEPTGMGMAMDDEDIHHRSSGSRSPSPPQHESRLHQQQQQQQQHDEMSARLTHLSTQLESALELSRSLQAQHTLAQSTISALESKVNSLESLVQSSQTQMQSSAAEASEERKSLTTLVMEWKKGVEGQWSSVQEEWREERERLKGAKDEWERRVKVVEDGVGRVGEKVEKGLGVMREHIQSQQPRQQNGNANGVGLVTPPSPRSLSSDSGKPRSRRKRSTASRGRPARSSSRGSKDGEENEGENENGGYTSSSEGATLLNDATDDMHGHGNKNGDTDSDKANSLRHRLKSATPWMHHDDSDDEGDNRFRRGEKGSGGIGTKKYPITPDPSIRKSSTGSTTTMGTTEEEGGIIGGYPGASRELKATANNAVGPMAGQNMAQYSTAVGVIVLSVAAVAVIWRVKAE